MPLAERRERFESMLAVLKRNDIHNWSRRFLEDLQIKSTDSTTVASKT